MARWAGRAGLRAGRVGSIVNGGAWLTVGGAKVDLIYRDLDEVLRWTAAAEDGRFEIRREVGYVAGIATYVLAGSWPWARCWRANCPGPAFRPGCSRPRPPPGSGWRPGRCRSRRSTPGGRTGWRAWPTCARRCWPPARPAAAGEWVLNEKRLTERAGLDAIQDRLAQPGPDLGSLVSDVRARLDLTDDVWRRRVTLGAVTRTGWPACLCSFSTQHNGGNHAASEDRRGRRDRAARASCRRGARRHGARGRPDLPVAAGVDVITGDGLAEAVTGAGAIIDVTAGPSPEQRAATEFFTTAARNLQQAGERAGVARYVVVSIVGIEKSAGGYGSAKLAHEQAVLAGPVPARILRVTQFHELVGVLMDLGRQGDVIYLPEMRTQIIAARTVAEALAAMATSPEAEFGAARAAESAGRLSRSSRARVRRTSPAWPGWSRPG